MGAMQQMLLGGAGALDTQVVTTGASGVNPNRKRGYISGSIGGISSGTSAIYSATINQLYWDEGGGGGAETVIFKVAGTFANSGWTQMSLNGVVYLRTNAGYSTAGGFTTWGWADNPFGSQVFVGTVTAVFT